MLGLYEFRDAGKSRKATSWITDPARFLLCSLLWPYFKRVLTEIEEKTQAIEEKTHTIEEKIQAISDMQRAQNEATASQTRLESRIDKVSICCDDGMARQSHLSARFEAVQKDMMAVASRLASVAFNRLQREKPSAPGRRQNNHSGYFPHNRCWQIWTFSFKAP